ncbi:MAG TPA: hypothetical protein VI485_08520, partial [Vicinamibacterales bacterium]|nr:hypothetical protein [Vicinamibacterales bacterium]
VDGSPSGGEYSILQGFSEGHPWRTLLYTSGVTARYAFAGQPERLIGAADLPPDRRQALLERLQKEADRGNRVVAFATKSNEKGNDDSIGF